jgi:hypothetical protein
MFDTIVVRCEKGPFKPRNATRSQWQAMTYHEFDPQTNSFRQSLVHRLRLPELRIHIVANGRGVKIESSLPKLMYGNNLSRLSNPGPALKRLREVALDYIAGPLPDLSDTQCARIDYCHNFSVGSALQDYLRTFSHIPFLATRCTYGRTNGVEWRNDNGRKISLYDKHREILENDNRDIPEALGILRFEIQILNKSRYFQRRLRTKRLRTGDALNPELAFRCLVETLDNLGLRSKFAAPDAARLILDNGQFSFHRATYLLGLCRRLETQGIDEIKERVSRSTFFNDKSVLRPMGLFPPSGLRTELPGLQLPTFKSLLRDRVVACSDSDQIAAVSSLPGGGR